MNRIPTPQAQIVRGIILAATPVEDGLQRLRVRRLPDMTILDDVIRLENFGLAGLPPLGSQVLLSRIDGAHHIVLAVEHAGFRFELGAVGEASLYDQWGNSVHLQEGEIRVKHGTKVVVEAPMVQLAGDVAVPGPANAVLYGPTGQSGVPSTKVFVAG